jgi:hypothetical protein
MSAPSTYRHSPKEFLQAADQALEAAEQGLSAIVAQLPANPDELQARRINAYRDVLTARAMVQAALNRLPRYTQGSAGPVASGRRPDIGTPSQRRTHLPGSPPSRKDKFAGVAETQVSPSPAPDRSVPTEAHETQDS